jgi:hypothetical protein
MSLTRSSLAFLNAVDSGDLELSITDPSSGKSRELVKVGLSEMAGSYIGDDGWRHRYSREKINSFVE